MMTVDRNRSSETAFGMGIRGVFLMILIRTIVWTIFCRVQWFEQFLDIALRWSAGLL